LELEIPRILGEVSGHMAWAGYLGYAIGLAVVRPGERVQIVLGAWLIAALLHGAWDTFGDYGSSLSLLTIVPVAIGCGSFLLLLSATLRARSIEAPALAAAPAPVPAA
jgi:RsiW-degrading membrane proteinase PrsW (M82 family)